MCSSLEADLAAIGRWPQVLALGQLVLFSGISTGVALYDHPSTVLWIVVGIPLIIFLLSLRLGASIEADALVVKSYMRTYRFPLEQIEMIVCQPYVGLWSGGTTAYWIGWRQLDVELAKGARSRSLPATMCGKSRARRLESALNSLIDERAVGR